MGSGQHQQLTHPAILQTTLWSDPERFVVKDPLADASTEASSSRSSIREEEEPVGHKTTMMIRDLPRMLTHKLLVEALDEAGFRGMYDFVYAPVDCITRLGLGYAFVNLLTSREALRFRDCFQGFGAWTVPCNKGCEVIWSEAHQGLEKNIQRLRNAPVMHESIPEELKPWLYRKGVRVPFPAPTKKIRAPRMPKGMACSL